MYRIIPKDGLKVINPVTLKRVPKEGIVIKEMNTFWKRRFNDKDITIEDLSKKKSPKKDISKKEENK